MVKYNPHFSTFMKKKLAKHRVVHIKRGNPKNLVRKHMMSMRREMKKGLTFNNAHSIAQEEYPMS